MIILLLGLLMSVLMNSNSPAEAQPMTLPIIERLVQQIELRRGAWIAYEADLTVHFFTEDNKSASCNGELLYHRLDEKILLSCSDINGVLLFVFKTDDRLFNLYIPSQRTAFEGNIFDLEELPDIESHLNPLDLYRALKPMALPAPDVQVESWDEKNVNLKVYGRKNQQPYLARRLATNIEGDVLWETYYNFDEKPQVVIRRSDYKDTHETDLGEKETIIYPHEVSIESKGRSRKTVMIFDRMMFRSLIEDASWNFSIPADTEMLDAEMLKQDRLQRDQMVDEEKIIEIKGVDQEELEVTHQG